VHFSERRTRRVWQLWFLVVAIILLRGVLQPHKSNCFPCYQQGGMNWFMGNDLYRTNAETCRYSPLVHAVFAPLSQLPDTAGATVWRLFESIVLLSALAYWMKTACPPTLTDRQRAGLLLITIPLMMGNLNSGQSNAVMMAGILVCVAALNQQRWTLAAAALGVACYFKIYPLALAMLLIAIYPRPFAWRFGVAIVVGALLPFLVKDPPYVARQYERWFGNLVGDHRSDWSLTGGFRDGWMLVRYFGIPMSFFAYRLCTVAIGAAMGLLVIYLRRRGEEGRDFLNCVVGMGCCWMTVFGPATEGHTYIFVCPTLAWLTVVFTRGAMPEWSRRFVHFSVGVFLALVIVQMTPLIHVASAVIWMPIATVVLLIALIGLALQSPVRVRAASMMPQSVASRATQAWGSAA
jgi:hypothetical protein